ncbi:DNA internalization-related competence protein ComEC/Rec2 [Vreelandella malpeensis]|uniref:DNA internalization-related competence protein ComEC/Rec2 n=1 Tax=Vreelandella malpeensis TaxID=1172368 RepID=A0ABS8DUN0_9GAMM|nr:DNA internalization-related competence protein ComEC/Rec2 [Halomonas malpeensis]MCB8889755.1 DNA internalization-related competence protein ComEC/Rec2 [Halomonas malpeensis]
MQRGMVIPAALAALGAALLAWQSGDEGRLGPWVGALALIMLLIVSRSPRAIVWLAVGSWVFVAVHHQWQRQLPAGLAGEDLQVQVRVLTAEREADITRLTLAIQRCRAGANLPRCDALGRVRVSAYQDHPYAAGERWQLTLRLRAPHGFANPSSFDYAAWLWREGIHATGYVRATPSPRRLEAARPTLRTLALERLDRAPLEPRTKRWLAALSLGDSSQLTQEDWALLNATGTTHLVVISGLHVGLVASFVLLACRLIARLVTPLSWRLRAWPWWAAGAACIGYALLAGMGPPALRAMVMTLLGLWVLGGRHAPGPWQAWWLALVIVVALDPLAAWRPGLWLSFVAVAWLIVIWQGRTRPVGIKGWGYALVRTQLLLAPLMAAAVLIAFGRVAPGAPLVNLLAVPFVSLVMVPLALLGWLGAALPGVGDALWWGFGQSLGLFRWLLDATLALAPLWQPSAALRYPLAAAWLLVALCFGLAFVPGWLRAISLAVAGFLPFAHVPEALPPAALRVTVHDVGQGQLVELESARRRMLYDTGPRFRSGFMPLESLWAPGRHFDRVLVSHADSDHAGGVAALRREHQVAQWLAPRGETLAVEHRHCAQGVEWREDGIDYRVLWPLPGLNALSPNERSCVLEVRIGEHRLLITGDAGSDSERRFLGALEGRVDVLVAGHHGSNTSSGIQFVRATEPRHVVFSAGRGNAFGHPTDAVVRRFRAVGSCLWNTAHDGALTFVLRAGEDLEVSPQRAPGGGRRRCR